MNIIKNEDFWDGWYAGLSDGINECRIEAFAAIRRAAEVARERDRLYEQAYLERDWLTCTMEPDGYGIRQAIRAAIGSNKT